jgi:integrase
MGQKNPKGSVSIVNEAGRIRLRWRYQTKRYSLNLFHYSKASLLQAKKIAVAIEHDMVTESFDFTLNKYKPTSQQSKPELKSIMELFADWVKQYRNRDCDKDVDYYLVKSMLERWGGFHIKEALIRLSSEKICAKTYNARLRILRSFFGWGVKARLLECNPFEDVKAKKLNKSSKENRKPFSEREIRLILDAFKNDTFRPPSSRYRHSHYYAFIYFIFQMGVRPAEAIGLRVKHLDFNRRVVEIREAMARTMKGTHAAARVRKETKNGKERLLPLDNEIIGVLEPLLEGKERDDLVFQSPTGLPIDDRMFQRRVFRKVLMELKLEVRVLYACRHTFGSRCIHEGLTPVMTAFLMGNNPETALRNYTHLIDLPKALPSINVNRDEQ